MTEQGDLWGLLYSKVELVVCCHRERRLTSRQPTPNRCSRQPSAADLEVLFTDAFPGNTSVRLCLRVR